MRRLLAIISLVAAMLAVPASASARPAFGIHTPGEPFAGTTHKIDGLERSLGRKVSIVSWFQSWGYDQWSANVQARQFGAVRRSHRRPLLTWEPWRAGDGPRQPNFSLARIAGGAFDGYIASWARPPRLPRQQRPTVRAPHRAELARLHVGTPPVIAPALKPRDDADVPPE